MTAEERNHTYARAPLDLKRRWGGREDTEVGGWVGVRVLSSTTKVNMMLNVHTSSGVSARFEHEV